MCIGVFLEACVLPANDHCFRDLLPSFSILLSISSFSGLLTSTLVLHPPVSSTSTFLCSPMTASPRCRFKQLPLSSVDNSSMQIESPPTLCLSHFYAVSLFPLPFRYYMVMRVSCLYSETSLTLLFFCSHICSLLLLLSCAVRTLLLPLVTLIRSVYRAEMTCVLMCTEKP